jgi:hypothetical protein
VAGQLVAVQRLGRHGFTTVARGRTSATGAYDIPVAEAGQYRVNVAGTVGPVVTVR